MEYAQLNTALTDALQITTHGNVEWDENNYCSAAALIRDGKADQFRVVPLTATEQPAVNPFTQTVMRDGCEKVGDVWQYKWAITDKSPETIAAEAQAKRPSILPAGSLEHTKVLALEEEIQRLRVTLKEYDANTTIKQTD